MVGLILLAVSAFGQQRPGSPAQSWYTSERQERPIDRQLRAAVQDGKLVEVRRLVAKGADVNARFEEQQRTPLMEAFGRKETLAIVDFLISKGAKVNAAMSDGTTPLHLAVMFGDCDAVKELIKNGASLNARTMVDPATVQILQDSSIFSERVAFLEHMFEPGFHDNVGKTPAFGVADNFDLETAQALLKAGADFKAVDANGWTILHYAVLSGNPGAIKWLVKLGLDPNAASHKGFRPLHVAVRRGYGFPNEAMVKLLLALGANPTLKNSDGQTPEELLRSDVAWRLRATDPDVRPEVMRQELRMANASARALNPHAAPIDQPKPVIDAYGHKYDPIELGDTAWTYWVRVESGHVVLRLSILSKRADIDLKIEDLMLEHYEPLGPLPGRLPIKQGTSAEVEVAFPLGAAKGGDLSADYAYASGSGSFGTGSNGEQPEFAYGRRALVTNTDSNRTMLVRYDRVRVNGKPLPSLKGRIVRIPPGRTVGADLPLVGPKGTISVTYSVNLIPNKRWWHGQFSYP